MGEWCNCTIREEFEPAKSISELEESLEVLNVGEKSSDPVPHCLANSITVEIFGFGYRCSNHLRREYQLNETKITVNECGVRVWDQRVAFNVPQYEQSQKPSNYRVSYKISVVHAASSVSSIIRSSQGQLHCQHVVHGLYPQLCSTFV